MIPSRRPVDIIVMESMSEVRCQAAGVISEEAGDHQGPPEADTSSKPERKYQRQIIQDCLLVPTGGVVSAKVAIKHKTLCSSTQ